MAISRVLEGSIRRPPAEGEREHCYVLRALNERYIMKRRHFDVTVKHFKQVFIIYQRTFGSTFSQRVNFPFALLEMPQWIFKKCYRGTQPETTTQGACPVTWRSKLRFTGVTQNAQKNACQLGLIFIIIMIIKCGYEGFYDTEPRTEFNGFNSYTWWY